MALSLAPAVTIADVAEAMGCKNFGDMCTVTIMYPKADGSYGFGAVRFTYVSGASVLESFSVAIIGDIAAATPSFTANTLKVEIRMVYDLASDASSDNTYLAAITSRRVNGSWLRSFAQFDVEEATPTFAAAIATYPVGQERFLNGSDVDVTSAPVSQNEGGTSTSSNTPGSGTEGSGSQGGSSTGSDTTQGFALTISINGGGSAAVTHNGNAITSGAALSEDDEVEVSITPATGQVPTATLNGSEIELTEDGGVYTGNFAMPAEASTLVINTGSATGDDGLDKD